MHDYIHKVKYYETDKMDITGDLVLKGKSRHCFLSREGKPISLRKEFPDFEKTLKDLACGEEK